MFSLKYFSYLLILAPTFFFHSLCFAQEEEKKESVDSLRIMFYNVENLFDPFDDSLTVDEEFTEDGNRYWTWFKFQKKLNDIYKTIVAIGNPYPPAIIGLCEIENRFVLNQLVYETAFSKFDYRIVQEESPDRRGIDVALLFDPNRIELLYHQAIHVRFPFSPESSTRDILYVKAKVFQNDTVHLFVNHWPSRWGGQMASEPKRNYVADILKQKVDSIINEDLTASIIIMGDFNDEAFDNSLRIHLQASRDSDSASLVNLMWSHVGNKNMGTHKYQGHWAILDHFIVSKCLLLPYGDLQIKAKQSEIFNVPFLLEKDEKYLGIKPNRTFIGYKYHGGISDHLPIYIDLFKMQ